MIRDEPTTEQSNELIKNWLIEQALTSIIEGNETTARARLVMLNSSQLQEAKQAFDRLGMLIEEMLNSGYCFLATYTLDNKAG